MTPELAKKLDRIEAACHKVLELDQKASRGYVHRSNDEPCTIYVGSDLHGQTISLNTNRPSCDGQFIAYSRSITPEMAKAVLHQIQWLEDDLKGCAEEGEQDWIIAINERIQIIADSFQETSLP